MIITAKQMSDIFGVDTRSVTRWVKDKGMPKEARGKYDLKVIIPWWAENVHTPEDDDSEIVDVKLEYWKHKARETKVKADLAEGGVVSIETVEKEAFDSGRLTRNSVLNVVDRLSPILAAEMDEKVLADTLRDELIQALEEVVKSD